MEVANMRVSEFMRKVIVPAGTAMFLAAMFYPLCVENGVCDYLKLWILIGIPFSVHRMFVWVIPKGFDIGGTVGVLVMNLLIGGVIGGIILIWWLVLAVFYLVQCVGTGIFRLIRKCMAK